MARKAKSGWEFGELFPPEETRRVLSVSELTLQLKRLLASHFNVLWVSGEISNFRRQASGHCYFTLKDAGAQLACVLFRGEARAGRDLLEDGRKVLLQGELAIYEPRGQYQLVVKAVEVQGVGALQAAFERLKQKLLAEGLFAAERKRPLPPCPERIGIVTSPTGAALRDVLHVVQRRQPSLELVLVPCLVQGEGAARDIADAIRLLNRVNELRSRPVPRGAAAAGGGSWLSLILVTRGGGSLEDLWAFNEEPVARAIHESALPVVSAVGHEIDVTIADFVADVRAATPSAAAEIITQDAFAAREFVLEAAALLPRLMRERCADLRQSLAHLQHRMVRAHPRRLVNAGWQHLDDLLGTIPRAARLRLRALQAAWRAAHAAWIRLHPSRHAQSCRAELERARARLLEVARRRFEGHRQELASRIERLRLLSPEHTLARGYSITVDALTGRLVRSVQAVQPGQRLRTRLSDGEFESHVR